MPTSSVSDAQLDAVAGLARTARMPELVMARLLESVRSGLYRPGVRLPTEAELARQFGVSRTVIREAVVRLKVQGVVESRQGSGVFLCDGPQRQPYTIDPAQLGSIDGHVHMMELRRALDSESAALAAQRRTPAQLARMQTCLAAIAEDLAGGGDGVDADIAFHRSIVDATGNPLFVDLWCFVCQFHLFKSSVSVSTRATRLAATQRSQIAIEHQALLAAIDAGSVSRARAAAMAHIDGAIARIRGEPVTPEAGPAATLGSNRS